MERVYIRLEKSQKKQLEILAKSLGLSLNDYVRYKLFDQNADLSTNEYVYHCPSSERYNYTIAGLSMLNYLLLKSLIEKAYGSESELLVGRSPNEARKKIDELYGYRRTKVEKRESDE